MRKKYQIDLAEVAKLNAQGMNASAIAKQLNVGVYAVYLQCKEAGLKLLRGKHPATDAVIAKRYLDGESILGLSKALKTTRMIVYGALKRQSVRIRSRSESNVLMMRNCSPQDRSKRAAAAHAAVRGMRHTHASLVLRAKNKDGLPNGPNEKRVLSLMSANGLLPRPGFHIDIYNIDLAFPDMKLAIEVDGGNWHSSPRKQRQDAAKTAHLEALGWRVVRLKIGGRSPPSDESIMHWVWSVLRAAQEDDLH